MNDDYGYTIDVTLNFKGDGKYHCDIRFKGSDGFEFAHDFDADSEEELAQKMQKQVRDSIFAAVIGELNDGGKKAEKTEQEKEAPRNVSTFKKKTEKKEEDGDDVLSLLKRTVSLVERMDKRVSRLESMNKYVNPGLSMFDWI